MLDPPIAGLALPPAAEPPGTPYEWHELAERHDARVDRRGRKIRTLRIPHGRWTIELGRYSQGENGFTRIRVRFRTRQPLVLTVHRDGPFYRVLKAFGMQDVNVPHPVIDRDFIVRTDRPSVAQSLLLDGGVSRALQGLRKGRLEIVRERRWLRRTEVSEVRYLWPGTLKDEEALEHAVALLRAAIDALFRLSAAREPAEEP